MVGADLIKSVRVVLRDDDYQTSSDGRFYATEEIRRALIMARAEGLKYIYGAFEILGVARSFAEYNSKLVGSSMPPTRARITANKLLLNAALAGSPQAAPQDFWKLECGTTGAGKYIPQEVPFLGDPLTSNSWNSGIYARGGNIYGTLCTFYYWALCTNDMGDATNLTTGTGGMPDAFYNAIKYLAVANLIKKEKVETEDRYKFFTNLFMRRISTLR